MKKTAKKIKTIKKVIKPKKKSLKWMAGVVAGIAVIVTLYLSSTVTSPKTVYIPQGSVFKCVAHLQSEGVNLYKIDALILRLIGKPQQGWIDIKDEKLTRFGYLYRLTTAKAATRVITLIPGETTALFLEQISKELHLDLEKLKHAYETYAPSREGNFVPDTYNIPNSITEEKLIRFLLNRSEETMKKWSRELTGGYDKDKWLQIVTKASVIQKEAASQSDMPLVSSVIENRLKEGMRLQMDGTLNYGEYSHQKVTALRIRSDKTPYNTYKYKGLPKSSVCNVSKSAIVAAIHPKQTNYLYFVRGKNGEHIYSSYFSTHRKNIVNATK
ncbi:MAG: endolytic transglycosylase MltG [Sulfuricurvum sp.]|uniref:endolytic transglycosylase MltG n=1 Tax=Sulfuricurvum sp. TaxID=2025608 RepID=UPI0025EAC5C4|nr:endolytic transglycosylase MltG [Sulfuricurvum sp.]MCK9372130.1 endolytic transglycosylase MltG [Sulfuricurvum sp.]